MIKVFVLLLQIDPLDEKQWENWATITVNSEIITWASSNDLCTFYRSQPAIEAVFCGFGDALNIDTENIIIVFSANKIFFLYSI